MDLVWTLVGLVFLALIAVALLTAVLAEPGLEAVRAVREGVMLAIAAGSLVLYVVVIGEHLTLAWSVGTLVAGAVTGYGTAWAGGHTALSGVALVPRSKLYPVASLLAAIVLLVGSLGPWIQVIAVGLLGFHAAVGAGAGQYTYRCLAARRSATVFSADVWVALDTACSSCGTPRRPTDRFCGACGAEQPHACHACGANVDPTWTVCGSCGAPTVSPTAAADEATWQRTCLVCATPLDADSDYCPVCGVATTPACPHCGGPTLPGEDDCPVCGVDLEVADVAVADDAANGATEPSVCTGCGTTAAPGKRFCPECGSEL